MTNVFSPLFFAPIVRPGGGDPPIPHGEAGGLLPPLAGAGALRGHQWQWRWSRSSVTPSIRTVTAFGLRAPPRLPPLYLSYSYPIGRPQLLLLFLLLCRSPSSRGSPACNPHPCDGIIMFLIVPCFRPGCFVLEDSDSSLVSGITAKQIHSPPDTFTCRFSFTTSYVSISLQNISVDIKNNPVT